MFGSENFCRPSRFIDEMPAQLLEESIEVALDHKPSMLQDVLAQRSTEIDQLNGGIVHFGKQEGIATPLNQAAWQLIKGLEASWKL